MLMFGLQACGVEYTLKFFPGYYYVKSCLLVVVAWPQLRLGRFLFFEFIKPSADYVEQQLHDLNVGSPENFFGLIPVILAILIFPKFAENFGLNRAFQRRESTSPESSVQSKIKSTSKKLSILTDYLDELELRSSILVHPNNRSTHLQTSLDSRVDLTIGDLYGDSSMSGIEMVDHRIQHSQGNNQTVFTTLSTTKSPHIKKSPTIKSTLLEDESVRRDSHRSLGKSEEKWSSPTTSATINEDEMTSSSPRHNRRSSLELLQTILRQQASSTLEFLRKDRG